MQPRSSPDLGDVDYRVLKFLPIELKECLLMIYNEIIKTSIFPSEWKRFNVFFIPKKDSTKFRSISMAQCTLKILY